MNTWNGGEEGLLSRMSLQSRRKVAVLPVAGEKRTEPGQDPLPRDFYERDTVIVARELVGKVLVRQIGHSVLSGRIVETEAYAGFDDAASHAFRGKTPRNAVMFSRGGLAYVYFIYGSSFCFNATSERDGKPGAVLIRALEPISGIQRMCINRNLPLGLLRNLTNGPGKLCQALKIAKEQDGVDLTRTGGLMISKSEDGDDFEIESSARIGITRARARKWRFFIQGNAFVSKRNA